MPGFKERIGEDEIILSNWDNVNIEKEKVPVIDNEMDSIESLEQMGIPTWSSTLPTVNK